MTRTATILSLSSSMHRAAALGLAVLTSLTLLAGVSFTADQSHAAAELAQAPQIPTQVVVVIGKRLPHA